MADELRHDRSKPKLAAAVTLYHIVVEASLAQPGQHLIEASLEQLDVLPGFREGMRNVSLDEQRHIGFGVKLLAEPLAESDECKAAGARAVRRGHAPYSLAGFVPPSGLNREYTRCYGFEMKDIFAFGMRSVLTKWRAIGYPMEDMPGLPGRPFARAGRDRCAQNTATAEAGRHGRAGPRPEQLAGLPAPRADGFPLARSADTKAVNGRPFTIQWNFDHADPGTSWSPTARPGGAGSGRSRRCDVEDQLGRLDRPVEQPSTPPVRCSAGAYGSGPRRGSSTRSRRSSHAGARSHFRSCDVTSPAGRRSTPCVELSMRHTPAAALLLGAAIVLSGCLGSDDEPESGSDETEIQVQPTRLPK